MINIASERIKNLDQESKYNNRRNGCEIKNRNMYTISSKQLWKIAEDFGINTLNKEFLNDEILLASSEFQKGFIKGIFNADGSVQGNLNSGFSIRLSSSTKQHLQYVQKMLLNLGINSSIYYERRKAGEKLMPDGHDGQKIYPYKTQHELIISKDNILIYKDIINFDEPKKIEKLNKVCNLVKNFKKESFLARFESLTLIGNEDVYDCTIPKNEHFSANCVIIHNCGEIPISAHGNCNLSSLNLSKYVENEQINYENLSNDIHTAIRFLDDIIDYNLERHPLPEQKREAAAIRRCGLGFMGLADLFILMKIKYGSEESIQLTEKISKFFAEESWRASIELAKEKGAFPAFEYEGFSKCEIFQKMPDDIKNDIKKYGIRNSAVNSIQPTGSTSIIAECSSGLEPIFNKGITLRRVRDEHDYEKFNEYKIGHPLLIQLFGDEKKCLNMLSMHMKLILF